MSDVNDSGNPTDDDAAIAGDGSGDPNRDRGFLQDLPPAQVDDDAVQEAQTDAEDDEDPSTV
ncbi:hypothetical protein [Microbacterium sp. 179-I 3D3 NHS]|uniref:hypothetical protein n=1 Tax=Microbacterium sp. 179-I 3D3 NHS TaxID=3142382 RepID=UPI0039A3ED9D